jgi:hypothetical protein
MQLGSFEDLYYTSKPIPDLVDGLKICYFGLFGNVMNIIITLSITIFGGISYFITLIQVMEWFVMIFLILL